MLNDFKTLSEFYQTPDNALSDWMKLNNFKSDLVEQLDIYYQLHKKSHKKIVDLFKPSELRELLQMIFHSDFFPFNDVLVALDLKKQLSDLVVYSQKSDYELMKFEILGKIKELCDFDIYTLFISFGKAYLRASEDLENCEEKQPKFKDVVFYFLILY